jgi:endoglucanase
MTDTFELLKTLAETAGPSGYEQPIAEAVKKAWSPFVDSFSTDLVGSLTAVKTGTGSAPRRRILVAAHMDEIGLMVSQIIDHQGNGFLRVVPVGGVDKRHLYGQIVTVHGERPLTAVIGALPSSMMPTAKHDKPYDFEDLVVDTGLPYAELKELTSIGTFISFRQPLRKLLGKRVTGKALDNRASVAAVAICLEELSKRNHSWDVVAVATSQEETRLLGAFTSAHSQRPDLAIAIDVTFGKGPGATDAGTFELGSGPVLDFGPNVHPSVYAALGEAADALEITTDIAIHTGASGTDAYGLQIARAGIPTGLIGIPLRYMHTMVESIDLKDVERSGRLLAEFIARLDDKFMDKLVADMMDDGKKDE